MSIAGSIITNPTGGFPAPGGNPVANFTISNQDPNAGDFIQLTDTTTNMPNAWSWQVNGSVFSTLQNPSYYCSSVGPLTFELTASNQHGSSSATTTIQVGGS